jgi:short-subunit dehydrogenase
MIRFARRADRLRERYGPFAVVTGASDGIGLAFARALAGAGIGLVLVARRGPLLERIAADLAAAHAVQVVPLALDVARPEATAALAVATADLDVGLLVAAAGYGTSGPLLDGAASAELEMVDVNCRAVAAQVLHFGPRLAARGRGGMILMSSLLAFQGVPGAANYAATKAYIQTLAEGLVAELAPRGVDVLACAPGPIHSGFAARAGMRMSIGQSPSVVADATIAALGRRSTVRPGWLSKALEGSLAFLPRRVRVRMMAQVMAGMTKHRHGKTIDQEEKPA